MESLYILIPVALIFCIVVIRLLLWAIDDGQYDDLEKEGWRILVDEDERPNHTATTPTKHNDAAGDTAEDELARDRKRAEP